MSNEELNENAWLFFWNKNPLNNEDATYRPLKRAGMNTDPDSYEEHDAPTFAEVIKSAPDPDMPKPDMDDGSYSTERGNHLIKYKQEQEGIVCEEE